MKIIFEKYTNKYFNIWLPYIKNNYPYFFRLIFQIYNDLYDIYYFFVRIYKCEFYLYDYFPTFTIFIIKIILFILFILPIYWLIKIILFFYKKLILYLFLFLDFIIIDLILFKFTNILNFYFKIRYILYFILFDFWFDYLIEVKYQLLEFYTWENILIRWVTRLGKFIKFFVNIINFIINSIIRFFKFIYWIYSKYKWYTKLISLKILTTKIKIKNHIYQKKRMFKWYIFNGPRWIYIFIKKKKKKFKRWFNRWYPVTFKWYSLKADVYLIIFNNNLILFFFAIFFVEIREIKIQHLAKMLNLFYRKFFFYYDLNIKIPLMYWYNLLIDQIFNIILKVYSILVDIWHKIYVFKINIKIFILKLLGLILKVLMYIFNKLFSIDLVYSIYFIITEIYNNYYIKYIYKTRVHNLFIEMLFIHKTNNFNINKYIYYKKRIISWNINSRYILNNEKCPLIRETDHIHYRFVFIARLFYIIIDFLKLMLYYYIGYHYLNLIFYYFIIIYL